MRKFLALALFLLLVSTSQAQEGFKVYMPILLKADAVSTWQLVKPTATTNYVMNPSAEITANFAATGSATITRSTTYQKYGLYSYRVQTTATNTGLSVTLSALTNAAHWMTARIRGKIPNELRFSIGPSSQKPMLIEKIDDNWDLWGVPFYARESNGATSARISQYGTGSADFYVDGIQVEPVAEWTTYCDGTQDGCEWNGAEHASTSSRSGESFAGGTPKDLYQEYKFFVTKIVGAGASPQQLGVDSYALLPGGELNSVKTESRQFTLIGKFIADTEMELHDARQDLIEVLKLATPGQSLRLRFNNARVQKEISVFYQGGLEGDLAAFYQGFEPIEDNQWGETAQFVEKASIQFQAPDPYWYEVGESATELDTNDSATFRYIAGRLRSTGQWSALGPPGAGGTYAAVYALAEDPTYIYIGGDFTNFDGIAAADGIVRYNKATGVYSAMGTGANGIVKALAIAPNGDVFAGGEFTLAGGVANTVRIARWDGSAWNALSTGVAGGVGDGVFALTFGQNGLLYLGGSFSSAGGVANTDSLASWDGTNFIAMSTSVSGGSVLAFAVGSGGVLYLGGSFASAGGVANTAAIASWNGTSFSALSTGVAGGDVNALAVKSNGTLYLGGGFTSAGGSASISKIASWNGTTFNALSSGVGVNPVYTLAVGADDSVYLGGFFTSAGGITLADRVAKWNGFSFTHLDVDLPGSPTVYTILASRFSDPVVKQQYSLFIGFDTTGTGNFAGKTAITNEGSVSAFPRIVYNRSGGTTAIVETLKNERTGKELLFNYSLLSSETLTIDLTPVNKSITSSFFGSRLDAILPNSDFGTWQLLPNSNNVTSFVGTSGAPTVTAWVLFREAYDSWD